MLRIPAPGRIEDRTVDGSCNPYLAATAMLAAGLDGIERRLDPGEPNVGEPLHAQRRRARSAGSTLLPANLLDATRELSPDEVCARRSARPAAATTSTTTSGQAARGPGSTRADHPLGARPLPPAATSHAPRSQRRLAQGLLERVAIPVSSSTRSRHNGTHHADRNTTPHSTAATPTCCAPSRRSPSTRWASSTITIGYSDPRTDTITSWPWSVAAP